MRLELIDDTIWVAEGETVNFYGFPYPTRSVVIRLPSNTLWIWSPIALTQALRDEIEALGNVVYLVSPNKLHHLYLKDWKAAFPRASLWGPRSTIAKRRDLAFQRALDDEPPPEWAAAIDQAWFRGSPFLDEIEFFHKPSATAIIADMSQNFIDSLFARALGLVAAPSGPAVGDDRRQGLWPAGIASDNDTSANGTSGGQENAGLGPASRRHGAWRLAAGEGPPIFEASVRLAAPLKLPEGA